MNKRNLSEDQFFNIAMMVLGLCAVFFILIGSLGCAVGIANERGVTGIAIGQASLEHCSDEEETKECTSIRGAALSEQLGSVLKSFGDLAMSGLRLILPSELTKLP